MAITNVTNVDFKRLVAAVVHQINYVILKITHHQLPRVTKGHQKI